MLNFRDMTNTKARVIAIENKGKYSVVKMRTARKDKKTDTWINSTWSFTRFIGSAHDHISEIEKQMSTMEKFENGDVKNGVSVVLKSVSLENAPYMDKDGQKQYPKNYQMVVWDWGFPKEDESSMDTPPVIEESTSDELPF
jgi:hypothetical protein